jgi:hypothetical protein
MGEVEATQAQEGLGMLEGKRKKKEVGSKGKASVQREFSAGTFFFFSFFFFGLSFPRVLCVFSNTRSTMAPSIWRRISRCWRKDQPYDELGMDLEGGEAAAKKKVGTLTILKRLFQTIWTGMLSITF